MKQLALSILFLSFCVIESFAQDELLFDWVQIAIGNSFSESTSIDIDNESNYYHCGKIGNNGQTDFSLSDSSSQFNHGYIAKMSANGEFLWGKTFIGTNNLYHTPYMKEIKVLHSGDIICIAEFTGTIDFDPSQDTFELSASGGTNAVILKFTSDGDFVWAKQIKGSNNTSISNCYVRGLDIDQDDNIYISGQYMGRFDFDPGPDSTILVTSTNMISRAGYLLKLNNDGEFQWVNDLNGPGDDDLLGVAVDLNNDLITTGYFYDSIRLISIYLDTVLTSDWFPVYHKLIIKYDSDGEALWIRRIATANLNVKEISIDAQNNFTLVGSFQNKMWFEPPVDTLYAQGGSDGFIANFNENGDVNWAHSIGGITSDIITSVEHRENGNHLIAVRTAYDSIFFDSTLFSVDYFNGILVLNEFGELVTDIPFKEGGITMNDIQLDSQGGLISVGKCNSGPFWPLDFDPNPDSEYFSSEEGLGAFVHKMTLIDYPESTDELLIYPNPSNGFAQIFYENYKSPVNVFVYDYSGRIIKEFQLNEKLNEVDLSGLAVGIHLILFETEDGSLVKKFMKF
ncbi:MAG: T9SS type A sorting domain-containing protein [Crocinitomicaceae bacterium]